jgi:hypothetical protein
MTAKRWLLCGGLFLYAVLVVLSGGGALILLVPVLGLAVAFGVIYGAVRLAIRHERRSEHRDRVP